MVMTVVDRYRRVRGNAGFRLSALRATALFAASVIVNFYAGTYATERASNAVTDIILSNTPVFNVDEIFLYGTTALILSISLLLLLHPHKIPFALESLGTFILIRSVFISLTHIGPFPEHAALDLGTFTRKFLFGGDLFFSGHTGIPFMMSLIFWRDRWLRIIFLAWSILFALIVLLGHYHYTIDVLSAYFITYSIYHIALWLFPEDHRLFMSESELAPS